MDLLEARARPRRALDAEDARRALRWCGVGLRPVTVEESASRGAEWNSGIAGAAERIGTAGAMEDDDPDGIEQEA